MIYIYIYIYIIADTDCSVIDTQNWFKEMCFRECPGKRTNMTYSQFEVVEQVAQRVCDEMNALASGDYESLSEPLRWSMHGGPGTGKHMLAR